MVRAGIIDSNQHENKWFCVEETSAKVYRLKLQSVLENTTPDSNNIVKILGYMNSEPLDVTYTP